MNIEKFEENWPEWKIKELIGEGSFGKVYKAIREERGVTSYSAIKVISIPQSDAELKSLHNNGLSEGAMKSYIEGIVGDCVNEIKLMESMKGTQNIVSVEDYKVSEKTDSIGYDIFIRMELLTSLNEYISDKKLTENEVIKICTDILGGLELCSRLGIIHRDIKTENIFVSDFGYFKLGDFGIACELSKAANNMSKKGTYNYMAPEVALGRKYDATADIYSLGSVLYKLLNNNRIPFLDPHKQLLRHDEFVNAYERRINGEPLLPPADVSEALSGVILKACAFNPKDRYQSPEQMRKDLDFITNKNADIKRKLKNKPLAICTIGLLLTSLIIFFILKGNNKVVDPPIAEPSWKSAANEFADRMAALANKDLRPVEIFEKNGKYGLAYVEGEIKVPPEYDKISSFKDGFAIVEKDGKCGFFDEYGDETVPLVYDDVFPFHDGFARVKKDEKMGLVNEYGKEVVPLIYDWIYIYDGDDRMLAEKDGTSFYIDRSGNKINYGGTE